jgi:1,2-diacylglycerol 3-alpha-glucosyltransferase
LKIVMLTNTYLPHVGGVANSVSSFVNEFRKRGHPTAVIAPRFEGTPEHEIDTIRVPAIQRFNGSDFSYRIPAPWKIIPPLDRFNPELVHAHHPFLLGDTALRIATARDLPLVFTHHTMYERYTHYVPGDSDAMRQFVIRLATDYANMCDHVIAPSQSIARVLRERGVETPITAIPTGIDRERFARGNRRHWREHFNIAPDTFVVGHVGRLAPEKNLRFLAAAVLRMLRDHRSASFLLVGGGPMDKQLRETFHHAGMGDRLHATGPLRGQDIVDAYHAMDAFVFASETETQGMVVAEAMAAEVPVVAADAPGVREVVRDGQNGRLLPFCDESAFAGALQWIAGLDEAGRRQLRAGACETADRFSLSRCADKLLAVYAELLRSRRRRREAAVDESPWAQAIRLVEAEWHLWLHRAGAAVETLADEITGDRVKGDKSNAKSKGVGKRG